MSGIRHPGAACVAACMAMSAALLAAACGGRRVADVGPQPCQASDLALARREADAGAGQRTITYALTNAGARPCTVRGRPDVQLASVAPRGISGASEIPGRAFGDTSHVVLLAPGAAATFMIHFTGIPADGRPCRDVDSVSIAPRGAGGAVTIRDAFTICSAGRLAVSPLVADTARR